MYTEADPQQYHSAIVVFCCTINKLNEPHLDAMLQGLTQRKRTALLFAFFTPLLELMRSENSPSITRNCNMVQRTLTLDVQLNRRVPCVVSSGVDCDLCGCFFPYMTMALREKDPEALEFFARGVH